MNKLGVARVAKAAAVLTCLTGVVVLLGWAVNAPALKSIVPGWPKMAAVTAFSFVLSGLALWFAIIGRHNGRGRASGQQPEPRGADLLLSQGCAVCVLLLSVLRLGEYLGMWNPGIDRFFFGEESGTFEPAGMAPGTVASFLLISSALLLPDRSRLQTLFQTLTLLGAAAGWLGLAHYLFSGVPLLPSPQMAVHTALSFLVLAAGVLCLRPHCGLVALLISNSAAGVTARRLVPAALLIPIAFGWLRLQGQRIGWYGTEAGVALFALSNILVFGGLIWHTAKLLHRIEVQRQTAEEAAGASQQLLHAIADNSTAVIYVKDLAGRYLLVNRQFENLFHVRRDELAGKTDHDLFSRDVANAFQRVDQEALAAGTALEAEEVAPHDDGLHTYLSIKCPLRGAAGEFYAVCGISTDITERKTAAATLLESEERYRTLAELLPHLVWTCTPDGQCDYLSSQWVEYTGKSAAEQLGDGWAKQLHPDDRENVQSAWSTATARGDKFDVEFRIRRADGIYRWFRTRAVPLRDAAGEIVKWFGSNTDFDDYKQSEQKRQRQMERLNLLDHITRAIGERQDLKSIFQVVVGTIEDNLPVDFGCICLHDQVAEELVVSSVSVRSYELAADLGMTEQAHVAIDQNGLSRCMQGQLVYEPDVSMVRYAFPQRLAGAGLRSVVIAPLQSESRVFGVLLAGRCQPNSFVSGECEFLRQLSEHVALAAHHTQVHTALQQAYDDLRQTQQVVLQQERLRALGQMASGIAHDINNALSPVALYVDSLLEREPDLSVRAREYLETIQLAVDDVAHTVGRMKDFYRQRDHELTLAPVQLNDLVRQVADLTRARWFDMPQQRGVVVSLETDLAPDLPPVRGIESEIREALINLVFNAVDAMPDGGTLSLRTGTVQPAGESLTLRHVHIEVADTGVGMDEETRRRCLEPFFTTKGERGTGLGLAMVYGVAQRHSAEIEIRSAAGQGTAVVLSLPAPPLDDKDMPATEETAWRSRLRILIVDDDPLMLKSLRDTLEGDGHLVVTANGGKYGLDAFQSAHEQGQSFSIVITDLGMPVVDGRHVAGGVKSLCPDTPVILLTGWGQRLISEGDVPPHVDTVLSKPPKLRELRAAFRKLVGDSTET